MRSVFTWLFLSCFAGLLVMFVHFAVAQGTRDLVDPAWGPNQPRIIPPKTPPLIPQYIPQNTPTSGGTAATGIPEGTANQPGVVVSGEMGRLLARDVPESSLASPSDVAPQSDMAKQIMVRLSSVLESGTEDEREGRELLAQRQRAERISDPERRDAALEQNLQAATNFINRLARRAVDEAGADFFCFPQLKDQYLSTGWCQLFDGHTDFGWSIQDSGHYAGGKFTFGHGEICSDPYHPGMVYTNIPFGDVTLQFDYWAEKDAEVFLLMKTPPNPEDLNSSCYTIVLNSGRASRPRGLLVGRHEYSLAQLRGLREKWDDPANQEDGTWHSILVRIGESSIQVKMDRRTETTYFDPNPIPPGHIAFLVAKGQARFCNVIWLPKQNIAVFDTDGRNDIPWIASEEDGFRGSNTDGFSLLSGSVESTDVFGNYVLQMQYYQGSNSGNSSLFVRGLPGQDNTGYEISLQNFPKRQDREAAVGVDAGSFRLRKDARYVRTQDMRWTHLTVAVMDRQLSTWVNGVPVCEIADRRTSPLPPGTGPYLQPGTIRFSVPDNNSLFKFRNLTLSPAEP